MEPASQPQFAKRMYNIRADNYEASWHPSFAARFVSMAEVLPSQAVLDLACGTGLVTFDVAARVGPSGSVLAVDISEGMLGVAKAKKERIGSDAANVTLVLHDITDIDGLAEAQGKSFDAITVASALVLLQDAPAAVEQWMKYLKPGGKIVVDVPHPANLIVGRLLEEIGEAVGVVLPYNRRWVKGPESLRELLENKGMVVEKQEFMEQAGYHKRYYSVDDAEAEDKFVSQLMTESGRDFRIPRERREKALELFKEQWRKAAEESNGKVEEVDGVWVAVARKPS